MKKAKIAQHDIERFATLLDELQEFRVLGTSLKEGMKLQDLARMVLQRGGKGAEDSDSKVGSMETSLGKSIDKIEKRLKIAILAKGKPRRLTRHGVDYLQSVETLFRRLEEVEYAHQRQTVYISAIDMACNFWIPEAMQQQQFFTQNLNVNVDLRIRVREWWEVMQDVKDGTADFGVCTAMPCGTTLKETIILDRPHLLLMGRDHKLASRAPGSIPVELLAGERFASLRSFIATIDAERFLAENNIKAAGFIESSNSAHLLAFVRHNLGVAFITADSLPLDGTVCAVTIDAPIPLVSARDAIYTSTKGEAAITDAAERVRSCIETYWMNPDQWLRKRTNLRII